MKITFNNCDYKYEIEAILKTFFPSEQFEFNFTGDKTKYDKSYEHAACKNLYTKLVDLTGHSQPWGILTGIRPVKKLNDLIFSGKSYDEASNFLKNEFFLSDEKFNLIKNIAENQAKFLKSESNKFSLYVGIPYCPSRCAYCSFVSHSVESQSAKRTVKPYIENLCKEIKKTAEVAYDLGLKPETIYVGGGTPTALKSEEIDIILSEIAKNFNILAVNEYTVEAGRPDTFSAEKLQILKKHGVRRISVNPQTTNDTVLKNIGRRHTAEDFFSAVKLSRENGFDNINADIIAGLPGDNFESFVKSIDDLLKFDPESITLHTLTYKRSSDLFKGDKGSETFSAAEQVDYAERKLPQMGLNPYYLYRQKNTVGNLENVGYAKPEFESLYNIYIMEENQNILACGAGASTKLVNPKTGLINRIFNFKYPYEYIARFDEVISRKEKILEFFRAESMKEQI